MVQLEGVLQVLLAFDQRNACSAGAIAGTDFLGAAVRLSTKSLSVTLLLFGNAADVVEKSIRLRHGCKRF